MGERMEFERNMQERVARIETILQEYLPDASDQSPYARTLREAMNYSVLAGGKRLRPMLMEASFQMFGGTGDAVYPFMAAIEMIHTYSLVHDDLPAMDNDLYRRGKKTTHAVYGEAMGILAGDALLNDAYEIVAAAMARQAQSEKDAALVTRMVRSFSALSSFSGYRGMVGGQSVDVESELDMAAMTEDKLEYIYRHKTGALIQASLMIGATLAGADDAAVAKMCDAGAKLGMAFQIQDDILDVTSSLEVLGKPIGSDEKNHKVTYVTLWGTDRATKQVEKLSQEAVCILDGLGSGDSFLRELFLYLIHRER